MKQYSAAIFYAFIYLFMTIVWAYIGKLLGFHAERIAYNLVFNFLIVIPSFFIYYISLAQTKRKIFGGAMTFRQGFLFGLSLTAFITILGTLSPIIITQVVSPDLFRNSIDYVVQLGMMNEADAHRQFSLQAFILNGLFAAPVFGILFSAIAALLLRRSHKLQVQTYVSR